MKKTIEFNGRRFRVESKQDKLTFKNFKYLYVTRITQGSPAQKLGVRCGDVLIGINKKTPTKVDLSKLYLKDKDIKYIFYRNSEQMLFNITTPNMPFGATLEHTSENILELCEELDGEPEYLVMLWQRQDWQGLLQASEAIELKRAFMVRMILSVFIKRYEGPGMLMQGIALYELGEQEKGLALIRLYHENYLSSDKVNYHALSFYFHALSFYYLGLAEFELGNIQAAHDYWFHSESFCHCVILQKRLLQQGVMLSLKYPWHHRQFPKDFSLPNLEQTEQFELNQILCDLKPKQLLFIVGLPWCRTSTQLDGDMSIYAQLRHCFADYCGPFYVITNVKESINDSDTEARLIKQGLPIQFLYDEHDEVLDVLNQQGSPNLYVLNKQGVVLNKPGSGFAANDMWLWIERQHNDVFVEYESE